jgi:hypothetical protein
MAALAACTPSTRAADPSACAPLAFASPVQITPLRAALRPEPRAHEATPRAGPAKIRVHALLMVFHV